MPRDSQLARELMLSYAEVGCFDPADFAARIRSIFAENRIVGRGFATDDQGRITHQDARCSAGSIAIAGAVALAEQPGAIEVPGFVQQLSKWMRAFDENFAEHVPQLADWITFPPEKAAPIISRCGQEESDDDWKWISPFVISSVLWSLYSFLRTPEDYWETVCTAIIAGGDVDTTAAMARAISGAHVGLERLPLHLAEPLNDRGAWRLDDLLGLSDRCYRIKCGEPPREAV